MCMWVSVEVGVLPVDLTVYRLRQRVWVSVESAVLSVDGIREWQWIGKLRLRRGVSVEAAVLHPSMLTHACGCR